MPGKVGDRPTFALLFLMRLTIEKVVYGGDGLARTDQGVVFVPRTAPGDVVEAEVVEKKKDYAAARSALTRR